MLPFSINRYRGYLTAFTPCTLGSVLVPISAGRTSGTGTEAGDRENPRADPGTRNKVIGPSVSALGTGPDSYTRKKDISPSQAPQRTDVLISSHSAI